MDNPLFQKYIELFLEANSKINLISKNDEKFIWEKHIYDSLSFEKFLNKYGIKDLKNKTLLDIGTGGGFPSVPLAIKYPELSVTALDSIKKKLNVIQSIKEDLGINNLSILCDRAENIRGKKYDFITSRAVAALKILIPYALPLLKKGGYFIAYKSVKVDEEIKEAQNILKKYQAKITDIIPYNLPLDENYTRNLVILKHINDKEI